MFSLFRSKFSATDVPDLTGKTAIITGSSSGLGLASTYMMASKGCHIIMACRSEEKTRAAIEELKKVVPNASVRYIGLDLSSLASVQQFADQVKKEKISIHILMNNAGIMGLEKFSLSKNDIELQFASNHLGPFYLTSLLLPIIKETAASAGSARIVNLSSMAHTTSYKAGIDFANINSAETYKPWLAYGQIKLANILFTTQLQKKLEESGVTNIYVNSVHPGMVSTNLASGANISWALSTLVKQVAATPANGALTQ
ncbi:WW domain-containing oxidoreductase-like protein, partial [Obelidium mucronatum]